MLHQLITPWLPCIYCASATRYLFYVPSLVLIGLKFAVTSQLLYTMKSCCNWIVGAAGILVVKIALR
ncbi:hypothetical protein F4801DRAFT_544784 [Xylaria longipes]|nr:hypothetical protein F4801DRAFT_544784 [Xylaria longipes]